ncbi:MAG: hypothetical protein ACOYCD_06440 [Kiritimatiellia bacterium]
MADDTTKYSDGAASVGEQTLKFLNDLGRLINAIGLYGGQHKITRQYLAQAYAALSASLKDRKPVRLTLQDDRLFVDNQVVDDETSFVTIVRRKLLRLEVAGLSLIPGITEDELFILARNLAFGQGPDTTIFSDKCAHIQPESSRYARVQESEVVVDKKTLSTVSGIKRGADGAFELTIDDHIEPPSPPAGVRQIIAFLKGDAGSLSDETARAIQNAATDINRLGQMIMDAAIIRRSESSAAQGESLADILVGCLRRVFDGLNKQPPGMRKPASIKHTMLLLEKEVLDRLRQKAAGDYETPRAVTNAVSSMIEDLTAETIAQNYVQRRNALEADGIRLAAYMRSLPPDKLASMRADLMAAGMTPAGWKELMIRGGTEGGGGPDASDAYNGLAALGALLDKLDHLMSSEKGDTPAARQAIEEVRQGVQRAADQAAGKIHDLESTVAKTAGGLDAPAASWRRLSAEQQARTLELVAEIVQELAQPLSAMNCAVDMTLQERIGPLASSQKDILALAADSGEKIANLFDRLRNVTGLPQSLIPDKESVYGIKID